MTHWQQDPFSEQHRSLFLSDLHLGAIGSRPDLVLKFLRRNSAETYVLVGDILDLWHPMVPSWGAAHQGVIDHLRARHAAGARMVYICGNHDPAPETAPEAKRLPVAGQGHVLHRTADGRRYLVVHGDGQDNRVFRSHLLTRLGSRIDHALRGLDRMMGEWLLHTPVHRRSLIEWLLSCGNAVLYPVRLHERRLVDLARNHGADGVICGHYHLSALHDRHGLTYANCGDWVDSFTALAEDFSGGLRLLGGRAFFAPQSEGAGQTAPVQA